MSAPKSVYDLVEKFKRRKPANETELRRQFVDPFFDALGWDVTDSEQVGHEVSVLVDEAGAQKPKRPDYGFRVDGATHFFVETKPPHLNLKIDSTPAFQLRRYGWSGNKSVSILTDFEEFCVYDCRVKPQRSDPASKARLRYYNYGEYTAKWNDIAVHFSRQAVIDGALRRWIGGEATRGVVGVDEAFLREMEGWRESLARDIALHNDSLSRRDLNLLVQRAIDRIVFLRIAEDRGIESYGRLRSAVSQGRDAYAEIKRLFREADDKYNSGLFDFRADALSLQIQISDDALRGIISQLYYPESPYEFSAIPADILGQVYERFLGKVIQLSSAGSVRIEEKPEVRKAGGVYYTPTTIVDYIVKHTVGALLDGVSPDEAAKLRVLDPACGSGSFLNGAYQYLLDWHLAQYRENPARYRNRIRHTPDGIVLNTAEKRRILLNNIYGVDLDQSAVEVTKLSLLLKMLENESGASGRQTLMFSAGGRILPDLGGNIKWGNSLISSDFYQGKQIGMFDEEALYRVKAFDWDSGDGFGDVMAAGGFDAVIGNPPYGAALTAEQIKYLSQRLKEGSKFPDSYIFFVIKALQLVRKRGLHAFIVPNTFCDLESCDDFRRWLLTQQSVLIIWQSGWAFKDAVVDTLVFVTKRERGGAGTTVSIEVGDKVYHRKISTFLDNNLSKIDYRNTAEDIQLLQRITTNMTPLGEIATVNAGVKMYERGKGTPPQTRELIKQKPFSTRGVRPDGWRILYRGKNIARYSIAKPNEFVRYGPWLAAPRKPELYNSPKILMRRTDDRLLSCIDFDDAICVNSCHVIRLSNEHGRLSYRYVLGLLNSRLVQRVFELQNPQMVSKVFAEIKVIYVQRLPIRTIDFDNPADVQMHDEMVALVDEMLDLHRQLAGLSGIRKSTVEALIRNADVKIDALVYRLYGLSEEEVALVEG